MAEDEKDASISQFDLTVSVFQNGLFVIVHDKSTKQTYQSLLTPQQLEHIGFSKKNVNNLHGIAKFIETAKNSQNHLQLQVIIISSKYTQNEFEAEYQADSDEDDVEGGVYAIDPSSNSQIAQPAVATLPGQAKEIALVKISKQDAYFGTTEFVMKLPQIQRNQCDINKEQMQDLSQLVHQQTEQIRTLRDRIQRLEHKRPATPATITTTRSTSLPTIPRVELSEETVVNIVEDEVDKLRQEMQRELFDKTKRIAVLERELAAKTKKIHFLEESVTELAIKVDKRRIPAVAKYQSSKEHSGWNSVQWDIVSIAPTSNGMISRLRNHEKSVIIGHDGLYRITFRFCSNEVIDWRDKYRDSGISVNGTWVAYQRHAGGNAMGEMTEILALRNGDEIQCGVQNKKGTAKENCSLILERIGDLK